MKLKHKEREGSLGTEIYIEDLQEGGYTAFFKDFPKIVVEGGDIDDAQTNLWNAVYDILKNFFKK